MKPYALALALLLCCGCYYDQRVQPGPPDPTPIVDPLPVQTKPGIIGEDSVAPGAPIWLTADVDDGSVMLWRVEHPRGLAFKVTEAGKEFSTAAPLNATEVRVVMAVAKHGEMLEGIDLRFVEKTVQVGKSPNPPPGPEPPVPPTPPTPPVPPPTPAPIPAKGLHVVIAYESGDTLSSGQQAILYGEEVRGYLDAKCQLYTDKSRAYRIYDKDVDVSEDWPVWQEAMKRPRESVPWVIVSNGVTGFEGPLPETVEAFLELVKKYEVTK